MLDSAAGMHKRELLTRMRRARNEWERLLEQIPAEQMVVPVINDGWSIKDAIGHITYYERWLLNWLEDAVRGQMTVATHRDTMPVDERNAIIFRENRDRALHDVVTESAQVFLRLLALVELLPEQDLMDEHRYDRYIVPFWSESRPLWRCIESDSYRHYEEHSATVRAWLNRQMSPTAGWMLLQGERTGVHASSPC
jgi:uncharacterized damage-inducible protein DinB